MNESHESFGHQNDCFDEAALWHARWLEASKSDVPPAEQIARWSDWIQLEKNRRAYDAVVKSWQLRRQLIPPAMPGPEELAADSVDDPDVGRSHDWRKTLVKSLRKPYIPIAAALLISFLCVYLYSLSDRSIEPPSMVATAEGVTKQLSLGDGSRVWLGSNSEISINFTSRSRTIRLLGGEALFDVAGDPSRPFVVLAGTGIITALGTRFSVRQTLDRVTVRVAEGAVKVDPQDSAVAPTSDDHVIAKPSWTEARLAIGQEVTYSGNQRRSPVESTDPRAAAAWIDGRREYRHEPLAYVVADINRCFGKRIKVSDSDIGELQFTGRVYESQVDEWLRALETIFPVEVTQTGTDVLLTPRRGGSADTQAPPTTR